MTSPSPSSKPSSSPPSRPLPLPPDPSTSSVTSTTDPLSVEDQIDLSTLSYLSSLLSPYPSSLGLFPLWSFRLVVFTSCSFLLRHLSPYVFAALRWTVSWSWWAFEDGLVRFTLWAAVWVGVVGTLVWAVVGVGLSLAYIALAMRPKWRRFVKDSPVKAGLVKKVGGYGVGWWVAKKIAGRWVAKVVVVALVGWEAWAFVRRFEAEKRRTTTAKPVPSSSSSAAAPPSSSSPSSPSASSAPSTSVPAPPPEEASDEDLERWARQVKEEMLRHSLLRAGRGKTAVREEAEGEREGEGEVGGGQGGKEGE